MNAHIIPFPPRAPFAVRVAYADDGWLVTCRDHGWLHGDHRDAIADANMIARGFGAAVIEPKTTIYLNSQIRPRLKVQARPQCPHRNNWHRSIPAMTTATEDFDLLYGSKYLSAADLKGQRPRCTIGKVEVAELKEKDGSTRRKFVVYFEGEDKALVVNKTNATKLAMAFGKDNAEWVGARVELYSEMTSLGKEGVRLQPLKTVSKTAVAPKPPTIDPELNDEIPY
jgi:hypothetical protein